MLALSLSHLMGMFYRTIRMLEHGIKPVYVFDGKPPQLKSAEVSMLFFPACCCCVVNDFTVFCIWSHCSIRMMQFIL